MYCSHCGKKVGDAMLFCPFCGDPIVIPEQDEAREDAVLEPEPGDSGQIGAEQEPVVEPAELPCVAEAPDSAEHGASEGDAAAELMDWSRNRRSIVDEWARQDEPQEPFEPLELDQPEAEAEDWRAEISRKKEAAKAERKPPEIHRGEEPVRLDGAAPRLELDVKGAKKPGGERKASDRRANTLVPSKTMNPNDIFMDGDLPGDDYDDYDDAASDGFSDGFVYEDDGEDSFFMRHLRGIVGLALFVILLLMFVIYAFSKAGQISLARANLAWSAEAYNQLANQSYQDGLYNQAGLYYQRALQRDQDNYAYASAAAIAYSAAGDTEKAAEMLKKCVEINPTLLEPYIYLLKLYPDAAQRPWDITQLLQQGYQQTGDTRLNVTG